MDTSFISHRLFVAALTQETETPVKLQRRHHAPVVEVNAPPERRQSGPSGKEVMAAMLARQVLDRAVARGI